MSNRIAVVCEGPSDFTVAQELIDQTLIRCPELHWVNEDDVHTHRTYCGLTVAAEYVKWTQIDTDEPKDYRRAVRSFFKEQWPSNDVAVRVRRVLYDFLRRASDEFEPTPYIVIVKDTDNSVERREQLQQVRPLIERMPALIGIQHTELECWLLAGFQPETEEEASRLAAVCRGDFPPGVGFNPCEQSHRLTATKKDDEKLSPKRVLKYLSGGDQTRELKGMHRNQHDTLKVRGGENGLADFLRDIEQRLIPSVFGVRVTG